MSCLLIYFIDFSHFSVYFCPGVCYFFPTDFYLQIMLGLSSFSFLGLEDTSLGFKKYVYSYV